MDQQINKKNSLAPNNICEIGCGSGEILNNISVEFGEQVNFFGYEISPQAYEICKKKQKKILLLVTMTY